MANGMEHGRLYVFDYLDYQAGVFCFVLGQVCSKEGSSCQRYDRQGIHYQRSVLNITTTVYGRNFESIAKSESVMMVTAL
jgi:hypothetical protein